MSVVAAPPFKLEHTLVDAHKGATLCAALTADGRFVVSGGASGAVALHAARSG